MLGSVTSRMHATAHAGCRVEREHALVELVGERRELRGGRRQQQAWEMGVPTARRKGKGSEAAGGMPPG